MIEIVAAAEASSAFLTELRPLLDLSFAGSFTDDDWEHALGGWHVVARRDGVIDSHAALVRRELVAGNRRFDAGYVEAVATHPKRRGRGLGSRVMGEIDRILRRELELGALSTGAHEFYARLGWERWRGTTWVRDGGRLRRSPDEDDGIMVLRFGPSTEIDLAGSLSCAARAGDDW